MARFRNVEAAEDTPVEAWPLEALRAALERGDLRDYRRVAQAIRSSPWGPAARRVEEVLGFAQPYGVTEIMRRQIAHARAERDRAEREWVMAELRAALESSGMTQKDFAAALGTSPSRLSTYLAGRVVPAATLLARARSVAGCTDPPAPS